MVKGGPFSLTRAEMESGRDERHPAVFSLPSRPRIFNGGNIYPAKGWRLVPIVFKLLRGGKIISPFFFFCTKYRHTFCGCCSVAKSCLTLCNPADYCLPGSSVHGILKARILEWVAVPSSRGSEKAMAPHSSTLAWKIPWTEEPGRLQSTGSLKVGHDWVTSLSRIGGRNGNPLQCSCLENPRDGGAWWAAVFGVAQSWT